MTIAIASLKEELGRIREHGLRQKKSIEQIIKEQIVFLNQYRKENTLSVAEMEALIKEDKELTQRMLARIEKIKSLTGT